ncbi:MAG: hypothetical protein H0V17_28915 [Deltaproteobacteria bacterium]|nr:hypothetical protein [Deltaproteobacteria bacterium]
MSDPMVLLRRLLAAWRASRDPALEPLIDKAGIAVARGREAITGQDLEGHWHEVAKGRDIGDVDRLLDASWKIDRRTAVKRIGELAGFSPDPRITRGLAEIGRTFYGFDESDVHDKIAKLITRLPSTRLLPSIDAIEAARPDHTTRMIYSEARDAIEQLMTTAADPALIERARVELGSDDDLAALLAQHAANPGDLALRAVIADRLQAAGDPRGEFIALQLDGGPAALRRANQLLATHTAAWIGPLPGVAPELTRFERGFLVAAHVDLHAAQLERSADRPEWSTIEELGVDGKTANVAALVARMPLLRRFSGPRWAVEQLVAAGAGKRLQAIVTTDGYLPPASESFPALAVLLWRETWSPMAKRMKLAKELGVRVVGQLQVSPDAIVSLLKATRTIGLELRVSWGANAIGLTIPSWQIRVAADRSHAELQSNGGRYALDDGGMLLEALADAGVPRLVVRSPSPRTRAAAEQITATKIEILEGRFDFLG